jgi:glycogen debranching enzyme
MTNAPVTPLLTGPHIEAGGVRFTVVSHNAHALWLCLFDETGKAETVRHEMQRMPDGLFTVHVENIKLGQRYGYRADGAWEPSSGHRFDVSKLLIDPHATRIDRPFAYHPDLGAKGVDTASIMPKAILELPDKSARHMSLTPAPGGLMYELCVKAFSVLNADIPEAMRGTLAAIAHPVSIAHFKKLGVAAVELMPVTAWIDERHLRPLNLTNAWGYNPVSFLALDPRLAPNGISDLRSVADALHNEGIALILDVVFNHTGESDVAGPVLSLRGLDNALYYRHHGDEPGVLINDTGTGNTLAVERGPVRALVLDAMRHFVSAGGVDGFRFDLCTVLGRDDNGFSAQAPLFEAMRNDPVLMGITLIAEPWDIGPGGYQLGNFPPQFLEWNDRYRDDIRRFWRGDGYTLGALAMRLSGSSDFFGHGAFSNLMEHQTVKNNATGQIARAIHTRSVNFLAAHDGFTLADMTAYKRKHNMPNGENDRDGHGENFSWNHGVEGPSPACSIAAKRLGDIKAMLMLLFVSRGTPLLSAGDEFARSQNGNNNAYAQDNETTWLNWKTRNRELEDFTAALSALRQKHRVLHSTSLLSGLAPSGFDEPDVLWFRADGAPMETTDWEDATNRFLGFMLSLPAQGEQAPDQIAIVINRSEMQVNTHLPTLPKGKQWVFSLSSKPLEGDRVVAALAVAVFMVVRTK